MCGWNPLEVLSKEAFLLSLLPQIPLGHSMENQGERDQEPKKGPHMLRAGGSRCGGGKK